MKLLTRIFLLIIICPTFVQAEEFKKIDSQKVFFGTNYSIGEVEEGFWGWSKEHKEVTQVLLNHADSRTDIIKSRAFNIAMWAAIIGSVITADDSDEGDSFDEANLVNWLPVIIGASFGSNYYRGKAVEKYNAQFTIGGSMKGRMPTLGISYRF